MSVQDITDVITIRIVLPSQSFVMELNTALMAMMNFSVVSKSSNGLVFRWLFRKPGKNLHSA